MKYGRELAHCAEPQRFKLLFCVEMRQGRVKLLRIYNCQNSQLSFFNFQLTFSMEFEAYLTSKRIDSARFSNAEPELWKSWKSEFEQVHPNSFTVQKLNLINPIRRKYQLTIIETPKPVAAPPPKPATSPVLKTATEQGPEIQAAASAKVAPKIPRPGMPKPIVRPVTNASTEPGVESAQTSMVSKEASDVSGRDKSSAEESSSATSKNDEKSVGTSGTEQVNSTVPASSAIEETTGIIEPSSETPKSEGPSPESPSDKAASPPKPARPVIPRPVIKPKPKPN